MNKAKLFTVGDRVKMSREFLRSTGMLSGELPRATARVSGIKNHGAERQIVTLEWESYADAPSKSLNTNLVLVDRVHLEPH